MTVNPPIEGGMPSLYLNPYAPTAADSDYDLQTVWFVSDGSIYMINDNTPGAAVWEQIASAPLSKAWASFDGTNADIKNSYNIDSITRNSTGNYTISFITAMPSDDYALCISTSTATGIHAIASQSSTGCTITTSSIGALGVISSTDPTTVSIACFG